MFLKNDNIEKPVVLVFRKTLEKPNGFALGTPGKGRAFKVENLKKRNDNILQRILENNNMTLRR